MLAIMEFKVKEDTFKLLMLIPVKCFDAALQNVGSACKTIDVVHTDSYCHKIIYNFVLASPFQLSLQDKTW